MKLYKSCLLTAALLLSSLEDAYTTDQPREQKSDNVLTVQNSKVRFPTDEERFVLPNIFSPIKALVDPKQGLQKKVASLQKAIERKEKVVSSLNDQITINRIERTRTIDIINVYQLRMKKKPSAVAEEFIKQNLDKLEEKLSDIDEKLKSLKNQLDGHEEDIEYQTLELGHLEKLKNQDLDRRTYKQKLRGVKSEIISAKLEYKNNKLRETDRQRQTDGQADRQTDMHARMPVRDSES